MAWMGNSRPVNEGKPIGVFPPGHPGLSGAGSGGNSRGASLGLRFGNAVVAYEDDTGTEKLAGLCKLGRNVPGMADRRALIGVLDAGLVRKQSVPVHDVKEVSHADAIKARRGQLPVKKE